MRIFITNSRQLKMVGKGLLSELVKTQDLSSLEQHLIFSYLKNKKLDYTQSPIL